VCKTLPVKIYRRALVAENAAPAITNQVTAKYGVPHVSPGCILMQPQGGNDVSRRHAAAFPHQLDDSGDNLRSLLM
jgi:hypothetical protein